jgi:hypothetical protein
MNDWIEQAAADIAEVACLDERLLEHVERIIATKHEKWLCEKLNGLVRYDCKIDDIYGYQRAVVIPVGDGNYVDTGDIATDFGLDFDENGHGFRPKEKP